LRLQLASSLAESLIKESFYKLLALFIHVGAAEVYLQGMDEVNRIIVKNEYDFDSITKCETSLPHNSNETMDFVHCWQCRLKLAAIAFYNSSAKKQVMCHGCLMTVAEEERENYKRKWLVEEQEQLVLKECFRKLKGKEETFQHPSKPTLTPVDDAPEFNEADIKAALKVMLKQNGDSVKCDNDHNPKARKQIMTKDHKLNRLERKDWKSFYWMATVDVIKETLTEAVVNELPDAEQQKVKSFLKHVGDAMRIMGAHQDRDHIVEYESGRGVLMLFGGDGTSTTFHLDISGALTYQFKVTYEKACKKTFITILIRSLCMNGLITSKK